MKLISSRAIVRVHGCRTTACALGNKSATLLQGMMAWLILGTGIVRAGDAPPEVDLDRAVKMQKVIHTLLFAFALDRDNAYPDEPGDANANFRRLFMARVMDDERVFAFEGDGWVLPGKPDRDIGLHPVYAKALEPGELSVAYVAGLTPASRDDLPLMIGGAGPAIEWITGKTKTPPAKVYTGGVVVTFVTGRTEILKPDADGKIRQDKEGKKLDIFSAEYGTDPSKIMLPAPVLIPKQQAGAEPAQAGAKAPENNKKCK